MRCLDQRARTILKVASEIVRQQDAFLAFGVTHLRPLNLKTVAEAIGMHESTVSRVTSNKYVSTPRGVFELKFFFTAAIASTGGGEAHSAESVRHRIRQLIEAERPGEDVHSDDRIVEILKGSGVDIARRTVAKYREAMRIPSSTERRRQLATAADPEIDSAPGTARPEGMKVQVTGKHVDVGSALRERVVGEITESIGRVFERGGSADVVVSREGHAFRVDCSVLLASGQPLESHALASDAHAAFSAALHKIEARVRRYKQRLKSHAQASAARQAETAAYFCPQVP